MIKIYKDLVNKLQAATEERKIEWERTSGKNEFQVAIGKYSVSVRYQPAMTMFLIGGEVGESVSLLLWNDKGDKIDEVTERLGDNDYPVLFQLYENVRRSIMKVKETLEEILNDLG